MFATIRDDMKHAQNAAHDPKFEKWDYSDIPCGGTEMIKGRTHPYDWRKRP